MGHFYFIRHGETVWNVENKICGATDIARIVESYFREMDNEAFSAFGVQNCAIVRYDF